MKAWIAENSHWVKPNPLLTVSNFHLGADLDASVPSTGMPDNAQALLATMAAAPSFIMVGTMEPRKGHAQTLAAFGGAVARGQRVQLVYRRQTGLER